MSKKNQMRKDNGFGLVEILIAISVLIIIVFGFSSFYSQSKKGMVKLGNASQCSQVAQSLMENFDTLGVSLHVLPAFIPTKNSDRTNRTGFDNSIEIPNWLKAVWNSQNLEIVSKTSPPVLHNSHLLLNTVMALQQLYNSDLLFCKNEKGLELEYLNSQLPAEYKAYLKIQAIDISLGPDAKLKCQTNLFSAPMAKEKEVFNNNIASGEYLFPARSNIGFITRVTIERIKNGITEESCFSEKSFFQNMDSGIPQAPTKISDTYTIANALACPNCRADLKLEIDLENLELGSVLLCKGGYKINSSDVFTKIPSYACDQFSFPQQNGVTEITFSGNTMSYEIKGLQSNLYYDLSMFAVDSAGNKSPELNIQLYPIVPPTTSTTTSITTSTSLGPCPSLSELNQNLKTFTVSDDYFNFDTKSFENLVFNIQPSTLNPIRWDVEVSYYQSVGHVARLSVQQPQFNQPLFLFYALYNSNISYSINVNEMGFIQGEECVVAHHRSVGKNPSNIFNYSDLKISGQQIWAGDVAAKKFCQDKGFSSDFYFYHDACDAGGGADSIHC